MTDMTVSKTILEQLGGSKFVMMTGAKHLTGSANRLSFTLPGGGGFTKNGINRVGITLNPSDTYDMLFVRHRGAKTTIVAQRYGVYADQLQELFTEVTGLQTNMPRLSQGRGTL